MSRLGLKRLNAFRIGAKVGAKIYLSKRNILGLGLLHVFVSNNQQCIQKSISMVFLQARLEAFGTHHRLVKVLNYFISSGVLNI